MTETRPSPAISSADHIVPVTNFLLYGVKTIDSHAQAIPLHRQEHQDSVTRSEGSLNSFLVILSLYVNLSPLQIFTGHLTSCRQMVLERHHILQHILFAGLLKKP